MKKVKGILFKILMVLYIIFIFLYLSFIVFQRVSVDRSIFGYRIYTVSDNTMKKYHINDIVLVKDIKIKNIKNNNTIAYYGTFNKTVVFHKVVEIKKDKELSFVTKGDNNDYNDPDVESDKVIGKVVGVIPVVSLFHHILKTQIGFFILVFLPLLLIILIQVFSTVKDINIEKEELIKEKIKNNKKKKSVVEKDDGIIEVIHEKDNKKKNIIKQDDIEMEILGEIKPSDKKKIIKEDDVEMEVLGEIKKPKKKKSVLEQDNGEIEIL